ncbi:UNVERIFIED_CONTAM: hypothetical protein PYX00_002247 [Menopon gallinae]|uniref:Uncharacterized protein n=1 Tax=Menopon gallinae TaxID=328185 RepID=A0AAW2IFQ0_9NEOP
MIGKVILSVAYFAAFASTEDVSAVDLAGDLREADETFRTMWRRTGVDYVRALYAMKINCDKFEAYLGKYAFESEKSMNSSMEEMNLLQTRFIVNAIDKNKPIKTFQCITKTKKDADAEIRTGLSARYTCSKTAVEGQLKETENFANQLFAIGPVAEDRYFELSRAVRFCKDKECVKNHVHKAISWNSKSKAIFESYNLKSEHIFDRFQKDQMTCVKIFENRCEIAVRVSERKMNAC